MTEYVEVQGSYDVAWHDEIHSPISGFFVYDGIVYEFAANASMTDYMSWDELHWDLEDSNSIFITDDRPELYADEFTEEFLVPLSLIESAEVYVPPESFEADWRDLNRDEKGRWLPQDTDEDSEEWRILTPEGYGPKITLRELSEHIQEVGELPSFDIAFSLVKAMLDEHPEGDTQQARQDLLNTIEDTRQVMEYNEETGYNTDVQIMVDMLRHRGIAPPEQLKEEVFSRIQFEDEWAAEGGNVPIPADDYTYGQAYGRNIVLLSESLSSSGDHNTTMEFEARTKYDPSPDDVLTAHDEFRMLYPRHELIEGEQDYLSYQSGSSNKQHYFFLSRDNSGNYFAFNAWGSIGYTPKIHRIAGPTSMEQAKAAMRRKVSQKINRKGYSRDNARVGIKKRAESFASDGMEMTPDIEGYPGLPVVPDSFGTNSALESGQGVPVWYGSAETFAAPTKAKTADELVEIAELNEGIIFVPKVGFPQNFEDNYTINCNVIEDDDEGDAVFLDGTMTTFLIDDAEADGMLELSTFVKAYGAEDYTVQEAGLPVIPDSYGTDSATEMGGRGVPVWYGSAETHGRLHYDTTMMKSQIGEQEFLQNYAVTYTVWDNDETYTHIPPQFRPFYNDMIKADLEKQLNKKFEEDMDRIGYNGMNAGHGYVDWRAITGEVEYVGPSGQTVVIDYKATLNIPKILSEKITGGETVYEDELNFHADGIEFDEWDKTEYEYKELEIAKPFGTGLKLGMGVVLAPVLVTFGGALLVMLLGGASDE